MIRAHAQTSDAAESVSATPSTWLVVLAAGGTGSDLSNVQAPDGPLLLPYAGRPVGASLFAHYARLGVEHVTVVARSSSVRMIDYVRNQFGTLFDLDVHIVPDSVAQAGGPATSLLSALATATPEQLACRLVVLFGDQLTYVDLTQPDADAVVFVDKYRSASNISYVRLAGDKVVEFLPKGYSGDGESVRTEVGGYLFASAKAVAAHCRDADRYAQISALVGALDVPIVARDVDTWVDVSRWDSRPAEEASIVPARSFNSIEIDHVSGTVTKYSTNKVKLGKEIGYYRGLPAGLDIFFPRLLHGDVEEGVYAIEYYPMKTVSEYFVFWGLPEPVWTTLAERLGVILRRFADVVPPLEERPDPAEIADFYWNKTVERLAGELPPSVVEVLARESFTLNGQAMQGWPVLKDEVERRIQANASKSILSAVHGDLCFSNILFDPASGLVRLIDPRGEFVNPGIYGDLRYDMAKLLHSVDGCYDFVIHDMFSATSEGDSYSLSFMTGRAVDQTRETIIRAIRETFPEVDIDDIRLIEAQLFLSMIPLHADAPHRQLAYALIGLSLLNNVIHAEVKQ